MRSQKRPTTVSLQFDRVAFKQMYIWSERFALAGGCVNLEMPILSPQTKKRYRIATNFLETSPGTEKDPSLPLTLSVALLYKNIVWRRMHTQHAAAELSKSPSKFSPERSEKREKETESCWNLSASLLAFRPRDERRSGVENDSFEGDTYRVTGFDPNCVQQDVHFGFSITTM